MSGRFVEREGGDGGLGRVDVLEFLLHCGELVELEDGAFIGIYYLAVYEGSLGLLHLGRVCGLCVAGLGENLLLLLYRSVLDEEPLLWLGLVGRDEELVHSPSVLVILGRYLLHAQSQQQVLAVIML
ncbi:MAG: hypothetical protein ACMG6E_06020 [Candidatus Roizmanbacteria bacterium]